MKYTVLWMPALEQKLAALWHLVSSAADIQITVQ